MFTLETRSYRHTLWFHTTFTWKDTSSRSIWLIVCVQRNLGSCQLRPFQLSVILANSWTNIVLCKLAERKNNLYSSYDRSRVHRFYTRICGHTAFFFSVLVRFFLSVKQPGRTRWDLEEVSHKQIHKQGGAEVEEGWHLQVFPHFESVAIHTWVHR